MNKILPPFILIALFATLNVVTHQAFAQAIEEVEVMATQSENEALNELASTAILDASKLADAGIENVEDVAAYVPNLVLTETDTGTNIVIRGIGAGVNQGFDQSVGLFIDGVPLPRSQMARAPFLDLDNVQVLRGPQYTLDGSYSIAGSVHMTSAKTVDEFNANLDFNYIPSQNDRKLLFTTGLPITDNFGVRFAVQVKQSDGYIENVTRNEDGPQKDELIIRSIFNFQVTDNLSAKLKIERGQFDTRGRQIEIIQDDLVPLPNRAALGTTSPAGLALTPAETTEFDKISRPVRTTYDVELRHFDNSGNLTAGGFAYAGQSYLGFFSNLYTSPADFNHTGIRNLPRGLTDATLNYKRGADTEEFSNNQSLNYTLNLEYWLGDHQLKMTTSYIDYKVDEKIDADFTAVPLFATNQSEEFDQSFIRFDYKSPEGNFLEFKAGISYSETNLHYSDDTEVNVDIDETFDFTLAANPTVSFDGRFPIETFFGRNRISQSIVATIRSLRPFRDFVQDAKTESAYIQTTLHFTESFRTVLGLRYTSAEKTASRELTLLKHDKTPSTDIPAIQGASFGYASVFGIQMHSDDYADIFPTGTLDAIGAIETPLTGRRHEEQLLPSISLLWDINDDFSVLASYNKANKLGGFDARSNTTPVVTDGRGLVAGTFEFEDEDATSFELGVKWYLPSGFGEVNATAFYTDYKNLQLSRFDGKLGFNVNNAGGAKNKGIEIEGFTQLTDRLRLQYSLAWIDFEFTDYKNGPCYFGQRPDFFVTPSKLSQTSPLTSAGLAPNTAITIDYNESTSETYDDFENTAGLASFCDFSGKTNQYVAERQGTFTFNYENAIQELGLFKTALDILYSSGYHTTSTQDPDVAQDAYTQLNGRVGISSFENTWEVALTLQNLTNRKIVSYANETPLATRYMGSKGYYGFVQSPRAVGINIRYSLY